MPQWRLHVLGMKLAQCIAGAVPAQGYKPPNAAASEYQTIPMNKIEDFGVHANQYYPLDVSFFKSSLDSHMLDMLWNKCALQTQKRAPAVCPVIVDAGHCCATIALSPICIQHWHACKPEPRCFDTCSQPVQSSSCHAWREAFDAMHNPLQVLGQHAGRVAAHQHMGADSRPD